MRDYFDRIADTLQSLLRGNEVFTSSFSGEDSDFVRFNRSDVRQAGTVSQRDVSVDLIEGSKHAAGTVTLSGDMEVDGPRLERLVGDLRERRKVLPDDPHLLYSTEIVSTERVEENRLPDGREAIDQIRVAGQGRDLVGIYASGGIHSGFANSLGQRNWYTNYSYNLDWSFYHARDKAVKTAYAGFRWDPAEFDRKVTWATEQLDVLAHPPRTISPGRYRVYLAPGALYDIFGILSWGGFGLKSYKTKQSPLFRLYLGESALHPSLQVRENTSDGVAPEFQEAGFVRPPEVPLIREGQFGEALVSPRSAKEYGVATNGAGAEEAPESIDVGGGSLAQDRVLTSLDTGLYINNVWYLNYSDRIACRTTGMTRFATFWVEHGKIQAPLNVMRFDETLYRALGQNLIDLTANREMILDSDTYFRRSTRSGRMPGALIEDFTLTL